MHLLTVLEACKKVNLKADELIGFGKSQMKMPQIQLAEYCTDLVDSMYPHPSSTQNLEGFMDFCSETDANAYLIQQYGEIHYGVSRSMIHTYNCIVDFKCGFQHKSIFN